MHNVEQLSKPILLSLPNGNHVQVTHVGNVHINSTLKNVFYVPKFQFNLLSISKLVHQFPCIVQFTHSKCNFQDQHLMKVIATGKLHEGLFILHAESSPSSSSCCSSVNSVAVKPTNPSQWHKKLGLSSLSTLQKIDSLSSVFNSKHVNTESVTLCGICPLAKQHKLSFPISNIKTNACFELIHCDLWGPYRVSTMNGCRYFLTIVDDYSRSVWTYLMSTKTHVFSILRNFNAYIQNHFKTTIKFCRTDHGIEFYNSEVIPFLTHFGIVHQSSCV